jgi:hypothetical protein
MPPSPKASEVRVMDPSVRANPVMEAMAAMPASTSGGGRCEAVVALEVTLATPKLFRITEAPVAGKSARSHFAAD